MLGWMENSEGLFSDPPVLLRDVLMDGALMRPSSPRAGPPAGRKKPAPGSVHFMQNMDETAMQAHAVLCFLPAVQILTIWKKSSFFSLMIFRRSERIELELCEPKQTVLIFLESSSHICFLILKWNKKEKLWDQKLILIEIQEVKRN